MGQVAKKSSKYSGVLKVRKYSDVELRGMSLFTNDPSSFGDFANVQPRQDEDLTFITQYEARDDLVCAFGHHHKRGFVLRGEDDKCHLIGCDCARTRYGIEWDTFVKEVDVQLERQKSLAWLHSVSGQIVDAKSELLAVVDDPAVAAFDQLRVRVRRLPQRIVKACLDAAHLPDKWLRGDYSERDLLQERKNKEKARTAYSRALKEGDSRQIKMAESDLRHCENPVFVSKERSVLRLPAQTLWLANHKMHPRLDQIAKGLINTAETLAGRPGEFNHPDMVAKSITATATQFDSILDEIDQAVAMFAPANLELFAQWLAADNFRDIKVRRLPRGLTLSEGDNTVTIERAAELNAVPFRLGGRFHLDIA
ncbi:hypothetical protein [Mesorhizobium australicum]|uniref:hypothetical protein n=1 Tax=Mesorhizobium australicum TaxID=536018 RepID=UPI00333559CB